MPGARRIRDNPPYLDPPHRAIRSAVLVFPIPRFTLFQPRERGLKARGARLGPLGFCDPLDVVATMTWTEFFPSGGCSFIFSQKRFQVGWCFQRRLGFRLRF